MSSKGKANNSNELPLLDEVNELIEKERLLLSLKLLEQKQEADEWKLKYDTLIGKVSQNVEKTGFEMLESAAESHEETVITSISLSDITKIISLQKMKWTIDLSGLKMDSVVFANICKSLFATRSALSEQFTIAALRDCLLTDEYSIALCSIFRNNQILAVDISHNELSELFFLQLVATLKDRRNSPQYLLLDGNIPLSETVTHFPVLLSALTNSLWGLSVTLMDFADNVMSHQSAGQGGGGSPKKKGAATRGIQQEYRESVKHPMKALEFLASLNTLMDSANSAVTEDKKKGKTGSSNNNKASKQKPQGRLNGLQSLCTLGLTFSHLSKKSISTLESTLTLTAATLVDLDLSFAYVGFVGAEMLRRVLSCTDCQIARLSLQGNAIGDQGLAALCGSFKINKTLTNLDVRSNGISDGGLRTVETLLCRCAVLYLVDLRNNKSITDGAVISICAALRNSASNLQLKFSGISSTDLVATSDKQHLDGSLLFAQTQKVKRTAALDRSCQLYSIDLSILANKRQKEPQSPVSLRFRWRPVQTAETLSIMHKMQSISKVATNAGGRATGSKSRLTGKKGMGGTGDDAYQTLSRYTVCFDLRLPAPADNMRLHSLGPSSSVTRRLFSTGGDELSAEWSVCSAVLTAGELPPKGALELHMVLLDRDGAAVADPSGSCVVVESMDLTVHGMRPDEPCLLTGGGSGSCGAQSLMSTVTHKSALSISLQSQLLSAGRGDAIHCHRWTCPSTDQGLSIQFDLRLSAGGGGLSDRDNVTARAGSGMPPQHETLGYEWFVTAFSVGGASAVVARGLCSSALSNQTERQSDEAPSSDSLLHAWTWRPCRATLAGSSLHADDLLVVSARPLSTQLKYPAALLRRCTVALRGLAISSVTHTSAQSAAVLNAVAVDGFEWASFAQHNLTACQFPM